MQLFGNRNMHGLFTKSQYTYIALMLKAKENCPQDWMLIFLFPFLFLSLLFTNKNDDQTFSVQLEILSFHISLCGSWYSNNITVDFAVFLFQHTFVRIENHMANGLLLSFLKNTTLWVTCEVMQNLAKFGLRNPCLFLCTKSSAVSQVGSPDSPETPLKVEKRPRILIHTEMLVI